MTQRGRILELGICVDVGKDVTLREVDLCYEDTAVWFKGQALFRHRTHNCLIQKSAEVDCEKNYAIFKVGDRYVAQRPQWDYNVTSPITFQPKSINATELLDGLKMESMGTIYGTTLDLTISHLLLSTKRATLSHKWSNGLDNSLFDESNNVSEEGSSDSNSIFDMFNKFTDKLTKIGAIVSVIGWSIVAFFGIYFFKSWFFSVLWSCKTNGLRHPDTGAIFSSIFFLFFSLFWKIPQLFLNAPKRQKKDDVESGNDEKKEKTNQSTHINIVSYVETNERKRKTPQDEKFY